jgi:hypothetical protein
MGKLYESGGVSSLSTLVSLHNMIPQRIKQHTPSKFFCLLYSRLFSYYPSCPYLCLLLMLFGSIFPLLVIITHSRPGCCYSSTIAR